MKPSLQEYLESEKLIDSFNIIDDRTVYFSSCSNSDNKASKDSQFWGKLFDMSYHKMETLEEATESTGVWKSSYDGKDIPKEEMDEWLGNTISRIKKLINNNSKVLEIGSGNGLIFNAIIEEVGRYVGTDVAEKGLGLISNSKKGKEFNDKISLYQLDAANVDKLPQEKFDLIIVNSVAQYFPSLDYQLNFIDNLKGYLDKDSKIFFGDIRSLELQRAFYLDILRSKLPDLNMKDVEERVDKMVKKENELLYGYDFFRTLPDHFDFISGATCQLKDGKFINELNPFRYDVTLFCNNNKLEGGESDIFDWTELDQSKSDLKEILLNLDDSKKLVIKNIPNAYLKHLRIDYEKFKGVKSSELIDYVDSSFFHNLSEETAFFVETRIDRKDPFKFITVFSKSILFDKEDGSEGIDFLGLASKLVGKKSKQEKELEEELSTLFPQVNFTCIPNKFLSNN